MREASAAVRRHGNGPSADAAAAAQAVATLLLTHLQAPWLPVGPLVLKYIMMHLFIRPLHSALVAGGSGRAHRRDAGAFCAAGCGGECRGVGSHQRAGAV